MPSYLLSEIAELVGAQLEGEDKTITGLATLQEAQSQDLSFLANPAYKKYLAVTSAGAVLVHPKQSELCPTNALITDNPYLAYAKISRLFDPYWESDSGIHPTAQIDPSATLGEQVSIAAGVVIGKNVVISDGVAIAANTVIGEDSQIGKRTRLASNVSVYAGVTIGSDCVIHSSSVIGADGFGFSPSADGWQRIHQIGGVAIGNRVEIGACTTIDRGALSDTIIEDGVIIDNHVQIAHNVVLGKNSALAGCAAVAGSSEIGPNCTLAGGAAVLGHLKVGAGSHITSRALLTKSIEGGSYSSGTPIDNTQKWRKNAARFSQLDDLARRLIKLEKQLAVDGKSGTNTSAEDES
ncbi:MAG: UDP-3-O-(3-hydroxymyristoyl)glucosamine N-acyltransferase [Cellvibrionaceae bacterium]